MHDGRVLIDGRVPLFCLAKPRGRGKVKECDGNGGRRGPGLA